MIFVDFRVFLGKKVIFFDGEKGFWLGLRV